MNWGSIAMVALGLVPAIVRDIEAIITGAHQGATKKQLAMASVQAATGIADAALAGNDLVAANAIGSLVSNTIDAVVTSANATGEFGHGAAPVPVTPQSPVTPQPAAAPSPQPVSLALPDGQPITTQAAG